MNATAERRLKVLPTQYRTLYVKVQAGKATRSQCIKAMCLECMGWAKKEVAKCDSKECPLHKFRPYGGKP